MENQRKNRSENCGELHASDGNQSPMGKAICTNNHRDFSSKLHNILNEQFNPAQPDAVWVSDITYIWTFDGFVYLTSIMDLYSRKIIAWVLGETLEASHVVECIKKAK